VPTSPVIVAAALPANHPARAQALEYVKRYEAMYGAGSVSAFGAYTWDAGLLLAHAIPIALKAGQPNGSLALYDRQRRTVTHSFTQAQTIDNMALIKGGADSAHAARRKAMLEIKQDDAKRRAYLLRQAMFESLAQAAAIN